jgi:hypothetical protein
VVVAGMVHPGIVRDATLYDPLNRIGILPVPMRESAGTATILPHTIATLENKSNG